MKGQITWELHYRKHAAKQVGLNQTADYTAQRKMQQISKVWLPGFAQHILLTGRSPELFQQTMSMGTSKTIRKHFCTYAAGKRKPHKNDGTETLLTAPD